MLAESKPDLDLSNFGICWTTWELRLSLTPCLQLHPNHFVASELLAPIKTLELNLALGSGTGPHMGTERFFFEDSQQILMHSENF